MLKIDCPKVFVLKLVAFHPAIAQCLENPGKGGDSRLWILIGESSQGDMVVEKGGVCLMHQLFVHLHILHTGAVLEPEPVK